MDIDFADRIVVVTGAAVGFGKSIAQNFAKRGALVHSVDIDEQRLGSGSPSAAGIVTTPLDVTDRAAVIEWAREIERQSGAIHVLVNNAGGTLSRTFTPIEETAFEDWDAVLDVNLNGAFNVTRAFAAGMKRAGFGRVINIGSGAAFRPSRTGVQAYTTAKHGVLGLTRHLAWEFGPYGITVNAVAPGLQPVSPGVERQWNSYSDEKRERILAGIPLGTLGSPQDIANATMFFASELAGYVTGQVLPVNGGAY